MISAGAPSARIVAPLNKRQSVARRVELLHDDVLLPDQLVDHEARPPVAPLDHHDLAMRADPRAVAALPHDVAQLEQGKHLVAQHQHRPALHALHDAGVVLERLAHVRERKRVSLGARPREQRAHDAPA